MVSLDAEVNTVLQVRNTSSVPVQADSAPLFRIYGEDGSAIAQGTLTAKETKAVSGASNASPIVITTSTPHGLQNGQKVTVTGVGGNTAANTTAVVANVASTTFEMTGVAGNGVYTSGGLVTTTGLYAFSYTPTTGAGFAVSNTYSVIFNYVVGGITYSPPDCTRTFTVV